MAVTSRSQTRRISTTKKVSETNDNFMTIKPCMEYKLQLGSTSHHYKTKLKLVLHACIPTH